MLQRDQGEMHLFKFVCPKHLLPPPRPHFKFLLTPLEMRLLIRMGFEETKRVQLGWFSAEVEVQKQVAEATRFDDKKK